MKSKPDIEPIARKILIDLTALYSEYRVRSFKGGVLEWLSGRLWRGNFEEFCSYLRQVIRECPSREVTLAYLNTREAALANRPGNGMPPPANGHNFDGYDGGDCGASSARAQTGGRAGGGCSESGFN